MYLPFEILALPISCQLQAEITIFQNQVYQWKELSSSGWKEEFLSARKTVWGSFITTPE